MGRAVLKSTQFGAAGEARLKDAAKLLAQARWTAAIYISGYGIECWEKAEIMRRLSDLGGWQRHQETPLFDALWKHQLVAMADLMAYPDALMREIKQVSEVWGTQLRYSSVQRPKAEAEAFVAAAESICKQIRLRVL